MSTNAKFIVEYEAGGELHEVAIDADSYIIHGRCAYFYLHIPEAGRKILMDYFATVVRVEVEEQIGLDEPM